MIHQNIILPIHGGNIPKAGKLNCPIIDFLGISPMPQGIMVHLLVEGEPKPASLLIPAGSQVARPDAPAWEFRCVADGDEPPADPDPIVLSWTPVGSVAIPPGLGLHVYFRKVS